jgi:hypothetical protein
MQKEAGFKPGLFSFLVFYGSYNLYIFFKYLPSLPVRTAAVGFNVSFYSG